MCDPMERVVLGCAHYKKTPQNHDFPFSDNMYNMIIGLTPAFWDAHNSI